MDRKPEFLQKGFGRGAGFPENGRKCSKGSPQASCGGSLLWEGVREFHNFLFHSRATLRVNRRSDSNELLWDFPMSQLCSLFFCLRTGQSYQAKIPFPYVLCFYPIVCMHVCMYMCVCPHACMPVFGGVCVCVCAHTFYFGMVPKNVHGKIVKSQ